jgi:hypothetical protein
MKFSSFLFKNKIIMPSAWSLSDWYRHVPAWVRIYFFFVSGVTNKDVLRELHSLLFNMNEEGHQISAFIYEAQMMFDGMRKSPSICKRDFCESIQICNDYERLRCMYRTFMELLSGYEQYCEDMSCDYSMWQYPCWRMLRLDGAKTKRRDHENYIGSVALKTDCRFWIARNSEALKGFGLPYTPFGFNSWIYLEPVNRNECIELGLIEKDEPIHCLSPAAREMWGLPLLRAADVNDAGRKIVVEAMKKWGIYELRKEVLERQPIPFNLYF